MSHAHYSYEDLRRRFEEQQQELEFLRDQRRDKDASITFLKTRITTLQNKVQVHAGPSGDMGDGALQALLNDKDQQIHELECLLASTRQDVQCWSQGSARVEEAGLLQQLREQGNEVEALRASLGHCEEELQVVRSQGAAEIADLRHRLQIKDEEVHGWRVAMQDLEQHCHAMGGYGGEDLQRVLEQNHSLSASLEQASLRVEELQLQLHDKEQEVGLLAVEVKALQQELSGVLGQRPQREQAWSADPRSCGEEAALQASDAAPPVSAVRRARTPPPLPRMPSSHGEATPTSDARSEVLSDAGVTQSSVWQDRAMSARGGDSPLGLQERKDTVLLLQQEIHKQIAQHRNSLGGREGAERVREAWAAGSHTPRANEGGERGAMQVQAAFGEGEEGPQSRPEPENYPMELTPEEALAPTQKPRAAASTGQRPAHQGGPEAEEDAVAEAKGSPAGGPSAAADQPAPGDKGSSRGGGVLVSLHCFDREESRLKKAKQQRMARQIEQRQRLTREKSRPDGTARRPRPGEEAGPPLEPLQPECSPGTPSRTTASSVAGTPRRAAQPLRDSWDAWPVKSATAEEMLQVPRLPSEDPEACDPSAERRQPMPQKEDVAVPNLHKRFATMRDEMKRQRGSSDAQQSARTAESVLSALMQQRSAPRLPTAQA